ncbi:DUF1059 domain-containing protein [archaeon]|jgi:hypothetical protein|nr:DUF1059 domain-containing protein [archaeon]MBT6762841.1 DUF1059 domain-containing protein [archaeon]
MKTMNCKQLGGACDLDFKAETFEEMAELSKKHGMEMFAVKDAAHMEAMQKMMDLMKDPVAMKAWFEERKQEFDGLPED